VAANPLEKKEESYLDVFRSIQRRTALCGSHLFVIAAQQSGRADNGKT
jgi:hypothetical protein